MNIQLNKKILFRKSIRQAYKNMFGRKPDLEYENELLKEMVKLDEEAQETTEAQETLLFNNLDSQSNG